jgi:prophage tail gpP-like protein
VAQWPKPTELAILTINGEKFSDWESVQVRHSLLQPYYTARFTCSEGMPLVANFAKLRIRPGDQCDVSLAGINALSGTVYSRQVYYDARRHYIEIQAVSHSHELTTASVEHATHEFKDVMLGGFVKEIAKPVQVTSEGGAWPTDKIDRINIPPGTTKWMNIDKNSRPFNVQYTSNQSGDLVAILGPGGGGDTLIEGQNIIIGREIIFNKGIYTGMGIAQRPAGNLVSGPQAAYQLFSKEGAGSFAFGGAGALSTRVIHSEVPAWTQNILKGRVGSERGWNASDEITVTVTVYGWLRPSGGLWQRNQLVRVISPMLIMTGSEQLNARTVTFSQDNETGTRTTLELCNPQAMGPESAIS